MTRRENIEAWAAAIVGGLLVILTALYICGLPLEVLIHG